MSDHFVLLIGPRTGYEHFNAPAFFAAERELTEAGYTVLNPMREDIETGSLDPLGRTGVEDYADLGFDYTAALLATIERVVASECDGVATLPDSHQSPGSDAVMGFATAIGKPVAAYDAWVRGDVVADA